MPYILSFAIGYLIGAIPFGVIIVRWRMGVDLREVGSKHTGGTNTLRTAGKGPALIVALLDIAKGLIALLIVRALNFDDAAAVIASVAAIAGHCWSIYIGFRGGMGIGTFGGLVLYWLPIAVPILIALWFALYTIIRHRPRSSIVAALLVGPAFVVLGGSIPAIVYGFIGGTLISIRHLHDWNRVYS